VSLVSESSSDPAPSRIRRVVPETRDAASLIRDLPEAISPRSRYRTLHTLGAQLAGAHHRRCRLMSSSPNSGEGVQITAKRVPGGPVSRWSNGTATADTVVRDNRILRRAAPNDPGPPREMLRTTVLVDGFVQ